MAYGQTPIFRLTLTWPSGHTTGLVGYLAVHYTGWEFTRQGNLLG